MSLNLGIEGRTAIVTGGRGQRDDRRADEGDVGRGG